MAMMRKSSFYKGTQREFPFGGRKWTGRNEYVSEPGTEMTKSRLPRMKLHPLSC